MGRLARRDDPALPVPLVQDLAPGHPLGGDDLRPAPAVVAERRGSAAWVRRRD